jgi:transcriptional regulator with XRE-family HTH domain
MIPFRQLLGAELRACRIGQCLRLVDVAAAAHVSHGYLSEVERGRKEASSELFDAICRALNVHPAPVIIRAATRYRSPGEAI